jgi:hypothetical protein
VAAGATQISTDSFTVQINRLYPLTSSALSWKTNSVNCAPVDSCQQLVNWNSIQGCVFADIRIPLTVAPWNPAAPLGRSFSIDDNNLFVYEGQACTPWNGLWIQADEPGANYCGPTAGKNVLDWYGEELSYGQLANEMNTNNWMSTIDKVGECGLICGFVDPVCFAACYAAVDTLADVGTIPTDMLTAFSQNSPIGYRPYAYRGSAAYPYSFFQAMLQGGDPVVVLVWTGSELHWTIVTGTYDDGGTVGVQLANYANHTTMDWDTFEHQWSFAGLDWPMPDVFSDFAGIDPYDYEYYQRTTELRFQAVGFPEGITRGSYLTSWDGRFELILDAGGNLVWYPLPIVPGPRDNHLWRSNTAGSDAQLAIMQGDGNFVIYDSRNRPLWATGTNGNPGAYLALQNDGNLVIYAADNVTVLWTSNTCCH